MSAAVVSGAVALLLEERDTLRPAEVKAAIQSTSTFMPAAGWLAGGAGSLNALAAAHQIAIRSVIDSRPTPRQHAVAANIPLLSQSPETATSPEATPRRVPIVSVNSAWWTMIVWGQTIATDRRNMIVW